MEINGRDYKVVLTLSSNRNAWARLRGDSIVISVPSRWPRHERERVASNLEKRAVRAIARGRWKCAQAGKLLFRDGQKLPVLGRSMEISLRPSGRFGCRIIGDRVEVAVVPSHPRMEEIVSGLVRKKITTHIMPQLRARIDEINDSHFGASLRGISVRDNSSRWGSCSMDGSISLNFRLLLMPPEILDYVIVHELAHTRYRSHGPRFWALVEKVMPGHKEHRKWLRQNGWSVPGPDSRAEAGRDDFGVTSEGAGREAAGTGGSHDDSGQLLSEVIDGEYDREDPY